jgi:hypothetical protein
MSNPAYRTGLVKIGKSDRDPVGYRKSELETTGVPAKFHVEYYAYVDDHHAVERQVHEKLANARDNPHREFFDVSVEDAVFAIRQLAKVKYEHVGYVASAGTEELTRENSETFMMRCSHCKMDYLHQHVVRRFAGEIDSFSQCLSCRTMTNRQVSGSRR